MEFTILRKDLLPSILTTDTIYFRDLKHDSVTKWIGKKVEDYTNLICPVKNENSSTLGI